MTASLTLVLPTITGREASLQRTINSYARHTDLPYIVKVGHNYESIGKAWADILPTLTTELAHLGTDDVTAESRWAREIRWEWQDHGGLAVPMMMRMPGETLESHGAWGVMHAARTEVPWCGVPIIPQCCYHRCAAALIETDFPQNYSDNVLCDVLRAHGHGLYARPEYRLGHWWADGGLGTTRDAADESAWRAWRADLGYPDHRAPLSEWVPIYTQHPRRVR